MSARLGELRAGMRGVKRGGDLRERRAVLDHVHRGRERGQRRGGEQHGEPESELDLDEALEAQRQDVIAIAKTADGGEVQRAEHEETGQDHDLGREHHAVGGPDQRLDSVDVVQGEAHARRPPGSVTCRQRQGREAAQCLGGPRPRVPC
jgi:hypothetical protein